VSKKLFRKAFILPFVMPFFVPFVTGCATVNDKEMAIAYYRAQISASERPVMTLRARPGETIVMSGVEEFTVYGGSTGNEVRQHQQQHHPIWNILSQTLSIAAPIYLSGRNATALADVVGRNVGAVARDPTVVTQPPPFVVTQPDPTVVTQPPPIIVNPVVVDPVVVDPVIVP
jgi:hypothetical protein